MIAVLVELILEFRNIQPVDVTKFLFLQHYTQLKLLYPTENWSKPIVITHVLETPLAQAIYLHKLTPPPSRLYGGKQS